MSHINIKITQYRVRDFISFQRNGSLELNPKFQRRPVWKKTAKSYLLDTVLRGLPVPIIFLREKITSIDDLEPKREVVDGQQRLRTILSFIKPSLIKDYNESNDSFLITRRHNADYFGKKFSELPEDAQRAILDYSFSVHILPTEVDDREVLEIFSRMNSTGVKLNAQELRNAEFIGEMKTSIYSSAIAQLYRWRLWGVFSDLSISRMEEAEFVSEFFAFMLNGISSKSQKSLDKLYEDYDDEFIFRDECEKRFNFIIDFLDDVAGNAISGTKFSEPKILLILLMYLYNNVYGDTSLSKKAKAVRPKIDLVNKLGAISDDISKERIDSKLIESLAKRRTTTIEFRKDFLKYLVKKLG